jgi:hypothetical protein
MKDYLRIVLFATIFALTASINTGLLGTIMQGGRITATLEFVQPSFAAPPSCDESACDGYACSGPNCRTDCSSDAHCADGYNCTAGSCVLSENYCSSDADCGGYGCEDSECLTSCNKHIQCAAGYECSAGHECVGLITCSTDADCATGYECVASACVDADPGPFDIQWDKKSHLEIKQY